MKTAIVPENLVKKDFGPENFEKVVINKGASSLCLSSPSKKYYFREVNITSLENITSYGLLLLKIFPLTQFGKLELKFDIDFTFLAW